MESILQEFVQFASPESSLLLLVGILCLGIGIVAILVGGVKIPRPTTRLSGIRIVLGGLIGIVAAINLLMLGLGNPPTVLRTVIGVAFILLIVVGAIMTVVVERR